MVIIEAVVLGTVCYFFTMHDTEIVYLTRLWLTLMSSLLDGSSVDEASPTAPAYCFPGSMCLKHKLTKG